MNAIGILGGSFDPVHRGHMQLARDALGRLPIGELRLIPAAQSWQKSAPTAASHRAEMVRLAIADEMPDIRHRLVLDMREIERGGATYTVDTLRELHQLLPATSLVMVMGGDQFERIDTWREWRSLLALAHIAVARRGSAPLSLSPALASWHAAHRVIAAAELAASPAGRTVEFEMSPMDVSSTEVRRQLANPDVDPDWLATMIPSAVLDYIRTHRLYLPE
jgi:nicotinate-nucleotide adenylyltransferase